MKIKDHMTTEEYKKTRSEHSIQTEIIHWLEAHGYFVQRLNSGVLSQANKDGSTRRIFMSRRGMPDIFCFRSNKDNLLRDSTGSLFPDMEVLFIEVKKHGGKVTEAQEMMHRELREYGARVLVCHSISELEEML